MASTIWISIPNSESTVSVCPQDINMHECSYTHTHMQLRSETVQVEKLKVQLCAHKVQCSFVMKLAMLRCHK